MSKSPNLPNHVALIIDGNRRWARKKGIPDWQGHARGAERVEEISKAAIKLGIKHITLWGGSYNNLTKRSKSEIKFLDAKMYRPWAEKGIKDPFIGEYGVRVRFIGEWPNLLSKKTCNVIKEFQNKTSKYSNHHLTYLIGYNGDREMVSAIKNIVKDKPKSVTNKTIKSHLWTKELPPVDLVIRTGEDAQTGHLSTGFMMWDVKDAILHFSSKLWPDFTKNDLVKALSAFSNQERRYGK